MQNKADLGKRYSCFKCAAKFYDLNKPEAVCPKCGADQAENPQPDPRVAVMSKYKGSRPAAKKKAPDPYEADLDDAAETDDDDDNDDDDDSDDSDDDVGADTEDDDT